MKALSTALVAFGLAGPAQAAHVQIAFIEFYSADGRLIQLEPGGRFAHVAISYGDGWLHAHPFRGVEVISTRELGKMGRIGSVVNLPSLPKLPDPVVARFLGKPYDSDFSWSDDRVYCSELIAKILGLAPEPMHFDRALWPERYWKYEGLPGLSPDKLFRRMNPGY